jgi:hypothetical protein
MKRIKEVIGQGDEGNTLQGHDATLVVVTVTGRKYDLPSSISDIVRQRGVVVTEVTPEAIDLDNIPSPVSSSQFISTIDPVTKASSAIQNSCAD